MRWMYYRGNRGIEEHWRGITVHHIPNGLGLVFRYLLMHDDRHFGPATNLEPNMDLTCTKEPHWSFNIAIDDASRCL